MRRKKKLKSRRGHLHPPDLCCIVDRNKGELFGQEAIVPSPKDDCISVGLDFFGLVIVLFCASA